jgi:hypothetical protein
MKKSAITPSPKPIPSPKLLPKEEQKSPSEVDEATSPGLDFCEEDHSEEITCYCTKCKTYICESCLNTYHFPHTEDLTPLDIQTTKKLNAFQKLKRQTKLHITTTQEHIKTKSIEDTLQSTSDQISASFIKLHTNLKGKRDTEKAALDKFEYVKDLNKEKMKIEQFSDFDIGNVRKELDQRCGLLKEALVNASYPDALDVIKKQEVQQLVLKVKKFDGFYERQLKYLKMVQNLAKVKILYQENKGLFAKILFFDKETRKKIRTSGKFKRIIKK